MTKNGDRARERDARRQDGPDRSSARQEKQGERDFEFELVRHHEEQFDPKRWVKAMRQKRDMPRADLETLDPGPATLQGHDGPGVFLGAKGPRAQLREAKNPKPKGSFGFAGTFAKLDAKGEVLAGTLALRFEPTKLGTVTRDSLRLFHWDEKDGRFSMVHGSRPSTDGNYVYGSVSRQGLYAVIGVNAHPLVLSATRLLCALGPFRRALPEVAKKIIDPICRVILCPPDMRALEDPRTREPLLIDVAAQGFPLTPGTLAPPPGNACEQCFGTGGVLPECELLEPPRGGGGGCTEYWESVGPRNISGCIKHVTIDPADHNRLYCAAMNGGVWMLNNINTYPTTAWRPLTDQLETLRMNVIEAAESNNQILYAASPEVCVYRSDDRGGNWRSLESTRAWKVYKILIHPADAETVFAATENGFQISTNGGEHWTQSRAGDIVDAAFDPLDSSIIYLCVRNVGVLKSVTAGFGPWTNVLAWSSATNPATTEMKIALGYRNRDGSLQTDLNRTVVAKLSIEIYVSQNGGRSSAGGWVSKGHQATTYQLGWNNVLAVDPFDPAVFLTGDFVLHRTTNGGDDWTQIGVPHEDQQSLQFARHARGLVYLANDGGVFRSTDGGQTWFIGPNVIIADEIAAGRSLVKNLATAEFYRVGVQNHVAVGNLYHSGLIGATSVGAGKWEGIEGNAWEFSYAFADPKRIGRFYVFHEQLARRRYPGTGTDDFLNIARFQPYSSGGGTSWAVGAIAVDARPGSGIILVSAYPDTMGGTGYRLMMTTEGDREPFTATDGSTTNQPTWTMAIDNGSEPIAAVLFAPSVPALAYAMSGNGTLFRKENIDMAGAWAQPGRWSICDVRQMAVNATNADRVYAVAGDRLGRSIDGGVNWVDVGGGSLPVSEFNSIVAHPTIATRLYLGADIGVFVSDDEGDTWGPYDDDLPNAEVGQIFWTGDHLYAVTHGRGLWRRKPC